MCLLLSDLMLVANESSLGGVAKPQQDTKLAPTATLQLQANV